MRRIELHISAEVYRSMMQAHKVRRLACATAGIQEAIMEKILEALAREEDSVILAYKSEMTDQ